MDLWFIFKRSATMPGEGFSTYTFPLGTPKEEVEAWARTEFPLFVRARFVRTLDAAEVGA